jgi:hypothetical protein
MALFPFSRARIGNPDFPWLPSICSNGTVIGTTATARQECARSILLPRRFFLRNLSGIARGPGASPQTMPGPPSPALYFMRRQLVVAG